MDQEQPATFLMSDPISLLVKTSQTFPDPQIPIFGEMNPGTVPRIYWLLPFLPAICSGTSIYAPTMGLLW